MCIRDSTIPMPAEVGTVETIIKDGGVSQTNTVTPVIVTAMKENPAIDQMEATAVEVIEQSRRLQKYTTTDMDLEVRSP